MSDLRTAAQQALEALEEVNKSPWLEDCYHAFDDEVTALRAALAEHDKKIVWVEERKAHWAEQLQLARETQERERQQREEAALAEPVQEPVAWRYKAMIGMPWSLSDDGYYISCKRDQRYFVEALYTAPPERKPLTEGEISNIWDGHVVPVFGKNGINPIVFARAIEAKHGIGEQQ